MMTTSSPCAASVSQKWLPMNPAPPVTSTFTRRRAGSGARPADTVEVVKSGEHVPRARPVRWSEYSGGVELVDYSCGAPVADLQAPLQERRRSLLVLDYHLGSFAKQLVAIALADVVSLAASALFRFFLPHELENVGLGDLFGNKALCFGKLTAAALPGRIPSRESLRILTGDECALDAGRLGFPGWH